MHPCAIPSTFVIVSCTINESHKIRFKKDIDFCIDCQNEAIMYVHQKLFHKAVPKIILRRFTSQQSPQMYWEYPNMIQRKKLNF